ncbi:hypothetical protein B0T25DRAFT_585152 [Lasiosphaeria hispida]|uniref:Uncharacterized protein n=1 Tax=Lasiosphaeria hispida TaxID=260671 RepID=A0AAJ0H9N4_9PEZI|nr:hypothetical protein B0T25DRAFT_585152 [Lasiosphaeria hispida]
MAVFCCCTAPRSAKNRSSTASSHAVFPMPPPPARLPGPLNLNPVIPVSAGTSPKSCSSPRTSVPTAIVPLEPVELGELVIEDSDSEEELESGVHSKSTSTLQLVRTHIRRHLSQDSLSRRKARSAVGSTQEEIERRAELKRLMHKRIQEELRTEEGQERPQSDVSSSHHQHGNSTDVLPGGGPRDNLEFSVAEDSNLDAQGTSQIESDVNTYQARGVSSDNAEDEPPSGAELPSSDARVTRLASQALPEYP